jgi:hypothetical protein
MAEVTHSDGDVQDEWVPPDRIKFSKSMLDMVVSVSSGSNRLYRDALPVQSLARIRNHVAAILIELRAARPRKPSHLRLVVDNT